MQRYYCTNNLQILVPDAQVTTARVRVGGFCGLPSLTKPSLPLSCPPIPVGIAVLMLTRFVSRPTPGSSGPELPGVGRDTKRVWPAALAAEAEALLPIVTAAHVLWEQGEASAADLAGAYILAACAWRRPRQWLAGPLKDGPMIARGQDTSPPRSLALAAVPALLEALGGEPFLRKKLGQGVELTVFGLFNEGALNLKGNTGNYINRCMALWSAGQRPCRLLFRVPSPMQVLRQQAAGERVVTMFITRDDLGRRHTAKLVYMDGGHHHSKDPLEFTLHDLKHMEHFVHPDTHLEQVGFFKAMLGLNSGGGLGPKAFFLEGCGLDQKLYDEMEYVISDMNTFSPHLLRYMLAKLLFAAQRKTHPVRADGEERDQVQSEDLWTNEKCMPDDTCANRPAKLSDSTRTTDPEVKAELEAIWCRLLQQFGMDVNGAAWAAAWAMMKAMCREGPPLSDTEGEVLRHWFRNRAVGALGSSPNRDE